MKKLISIFILLITFSSFAQFKLPQKKDWEIAKTMPIVIIQLDDDDENAAVFNTNIKKYVEEIFGVERVEKYLTFDEFKKFSKGNKEKYNFIGYKNNKHNKSELGNEWFSQIYFGIIGKSFMINGGYLSTVVYQDKSTLFKKNTKILTEAEIKFAVGIFKNDIESGFNVGDRFLGDLMKESKKTLKEININSSKLKDLTLLIDKDLFGENLINEFSKSYKYKFEAVSKERIESAILNNEKNTAFIYEYTRPGSDSRIKTMLYIYNSEDYSNLFAYSPSSGTGLGFVDLLNSLTSNFSKEYVEKLNSVIE